MYHEGSIHILGIPRLFFARFLLINQPCLNHLHPDILYLPPPHSRPSSLPLPLHRRILPPPPESVMIEVPHRQSQSPHAGGYPEMHRDFEQMNINPSPSFGHNDNTHNPQDLHFDVHPGGQGSNGELFNGLGSSSPGYEGCIITRKTVPGQEKIWGIVRREEMQDSQDQLKSEIRRERKSGMDVYNRPEMKGMKRRQIDKLIYDKSVDNPGCKYKLVYLKLERSWDKKIVRAMRVILKREPAPGNTNFRIRPLSGETVDLTGGHIHTDLGSSYGSSSGDLHGSSPPHRSFVPKMQQMFTEPISSHAPRAEPWVHIRPDNQGPPHPSHNSEHASPQFDLPQGNPPRPNAGFNGPSPDFQQPHHDDHFQSEPIYEGRPHPDSHQGSHQGPVPNGKSYPKNGTSDDRHQPDFSERRPHLDSNPHANNRSKNGKGNEKNSNKDYAKNYSDFPPHSESDGYETYSDHSGFSKTRSNQTRDTELSDEEYHKEKRHSAKQNDKRRDSYSSRDPNHYSSERDNRRQGHRLGRKDSRRSSRSSHDYERDFHGAVRQHRRKSPHHSASSSQSSGTRYFVDDYEFIPSKTSRRERGQSFHRGSGFSQEPHPTLHRRASSSEEETRGTRRRNRMPSFSHPVDLHDGRADLAEQIAKDVAQKLRNDGLEKENEDLRRRQAMMENAGHMRARPLSGYAEPHMPQYTDQYADLPYSELPRHNRRFSRNLQRGGRFGGMV